MNRAEQSDRVHFSPYWGEFDTELPRLVVHRWAILDDFSNFNSFFLLKLDLSPSRNKKIVHPVFFFFLKKVLVCIADCFFTQGGIFMLLTCLSDISSKVMYN